MDRAKWIRLQKYESRIANLLNDFISKEVYNSTLKFAKIMYVKMSSDFGALKIYVDCLDRTKIDDLVKKLNENKGIFRSHIANNYSFKKAPTILFVKDEVIDRVDELEAILGGLKKKGLEND